MARKDNTVRQAVLKHVKKMFSRRTCLHPDAPRGCGEGVAVAAHSVSRAKALALIAENGHVLRLRTDPPIRARNDGLPLADRVGLRKATTFTGFCAAHDAALFKPIETDEFHLSAETAFLLGYRALCRGLWAKEAEVEGMESEPPEVAEAASQVGSRDMLDAGLAGSRKGRGELNSLKAAHDRMLQQAQFERYCYYAVEFAVVPTVMCSGHYLVEMDFIGNNLQPEFHQRTAQYMSFNLVGVDGRGFAVLGCVDGNDCARRFAESLDAVPNDKVSRALVRFAFTFFENVVFAESWWKNLGETDRRSLLHRSLCLVTYEPTATVLVDDGLLLVNWRPSRRIVSWPGWHTSPSRE